eukprot:TRINITY_DN18666_c0_g1_i1.p1 TRINITY_DN18666_c0_g1~~TRINITY_DN18666_c0_g1_i1.p1  ORF type:complete len:532 (+),score=126.28 TRINITY_DN18666_c0_g1_i1:116-1597(+)
MAEQAAPAEMPEDPLMNKLPPDLRALFQSRGRLVWVGVVMKMNRKWTDEKQNVGDKRFAVVTSEGLFLVENKTLKRCVAHRKLSLVSTPGRLEEFAAFRVGAPSAAEKEAQPKEPKQTDHEHGIVLRFVESAARSASERRDEMVAAVKRAYLANTGRALPAEELPLSKPPRKLCTWVNRTKSKGWKNNPDEGLISSGGHPPPPEGPSTTLPPTPAAPPVAPPSDTPAPEVEAEGTRLEYDMRPEHAAGDAYGYDAGGAIESAPVEHGQDMRFQTLRESIVATEAPQGGGGGYDPSSRMSTMKVSSAHTAAPTAGDTGTHLHSVTFDVPVPTHASITQYPLTMGRGMGGNRTRGGLPIGVTPGELRRELISPQRPIHHFGYDLASPAAAPPLPPPIWAAHHPAHSLAGDTTRPMPPGPQGVYPSSSAYVTTAPPGDVGHWHGAQAHSANPSAGRGRGIPAPPTRDVSHLHGHRPQYAPPVPPGLAAGPSQPALV